MSLERLTGAVPGVAANGLTVSSSYEGAWIDSGLYGEAAGGRRVEARCIVHEPIMATRPVWSWTHRHTLGRLVYIIGARYAERHGYPPDPGQRS